MSTHERAFYIFNQLTEKQLEAFITLFSGNVALIPETEPDEWDIQMIEDSMTDNEESVPLDSFVEELGFCPNDL